MKYLNLKNFLKIDEKLFLFIIETFMIMGVFQRQARKEGWTQEEIDLVLKEAKSSDYNHLLATISNHCEVID